MNTALTALRDKECHEIAHESPKYSGYPEHLETAKLAWDAAIQALTTAAGEFPFEEFEAEYTKLVALGDWLICQHIAKWMHRQMSARVGDYNLMSTSLDYALEKIKSLEARLVESECEIEAHYTPNRIHEMLQSKLAAAEARVKELEG